MRLGNKSFVVFLALKLAKNFPVVVGWSVNIYRRRRQPPSPLRNNTYPESDKTEYNVAFNYYKIWDGKNNRGSRTKKTTTQIPTYTSQYILTEKYG